MNSATTYGSDRGAIHGKTVWQKPSKFRFMVITIPASLHEQLHDVTLVTDVMLVNGFPFFVTLLCDIKLLTVEFLPTCITIPLCSNMTKVMMVYCWGGFLVQIALMDM